MTATDLALAYMLGALLALVGVGIPMLFRDVRARYETVTAEDPALDVAGISSLAVVLLAAALWPVTLAVFVREWQRGGAA